LGAARFRYLFPVLFSFLLQKIKFVWANSSKGAKNNPKDAVRLISDFRKERYKRPPAARGQPFSNVATTH
jgi:hypothetical protein